MEPPYNPGRYYARMGRVLSHGGYSSETVWALVIAGNCAWSRSAAMRFENRLRYQVGAKGEGHCQPNVRKAGLTWCFVLDGLLDPFFHLISPRIGISRGC
jgi:hypothetical protein